MRCTHCGAMIPDDQVVCPECGAEVQIVLDYNPLDDVLTREVKVLLRELHVRSGRMISEDTEETTGRKM